MENLIIREVHRPKPESSVWNHPALALFPKPEDIAKPLQPSRLFLVPTSFGETYEQEVAPLATPKNELPDLQNWVRRFVISVIEIWSGRRTPLQVSRWCHRTIYQELLRKIGTFKSALYIRKIYLSEPIEGVGEVVVTLRIGERIRSLVIRIEGVDHRWICTELYLI